MQPTRYVVSMIINCYFIVHVLYADNCTEGDIRLVGGQTDLMGRVEICLEQQWGTVCDSLWGSSDAEVVCRQLRLGSTGLYLYPNPNPNPMVA